MKYLVLFAMLAACGDNIHPDLPPDHTAVDGGKYDITICPLPPTCPVCPEQPAAEPDVCDGVLICHGEQCYERCCSDAQCAAGESCRWGVCRTGAGW